MVFLADLVETVDHLVRTGEHLLGGGGLGGLRAQLRGLLTQGVRLLLGVGLLASATGLVGGAGVQVLLPRHVVDVSLAAHGVEEPDLVDHVIEQLDIVGDHDQAALVLLKEAAQPVDRVRVEVVGRLVEQQRRLRPAGAGGRGEEDLGELHATALTTRESLQLLVENALRQAEPVTDTGGLGIGLVAAEGTVALLQAAVLADGRVPLGVGAGFHEFLLPVHG